MQTLVRLRFGYVILFIFKQPLVLIFETYATSNDNNKTKIIIILINS
jgi:hypothetical protein